MSKYRNVSKRRHWRPRENLSVRINALTHNHAAGDPIPGITCGIGNIVVWGNTNNDRALIGVEDRRLERNTIYEHLIAPHAVFCTYVSGRSPADGPKVTDSDDLSVQTGQRFDGVGRWCREIMLKYHKVSK